MSLVSRMANYWRRTGQPPLATGEADSVTFHTRWGQEERWSLPVTSPDGPVAERVVHARGATFPQRDRLAVRVFLRDQVLRLSMPRTVHPTVEYAFGEPSARGKSTPLLPHLRPHAPFVSAGELLVKAKQFDDGLMAAVEMASQEACGSFGGRRPLLRALLDHAAGEGRAAAHVAAACDAGGVRPTRTAEAAQVLREFLSDEWRSKPLGFYTWNDELGRIFRQDRLLQTDLSEAADAGDLAGALAGTPGLRARYEQCLRLAERCTNGPACADFREWIIAIDRGDPPPPIIRSHPFPPWLALFPPSRAHETDLATRLYGDRPIPDDADLLRDLIQAVRTGRVVLAPRPDSGWYDWQTWALETLIAPERAEETGRLTLTKSYREHLEHLFRTALALARETHVKQLTVPMRGAALGPPVIVRPELHLEPLVTHYARRAEGYRFIRAVLAEAFGDAALGHLHRLRPDGVVEPTLAEELEFMTALFEGAANVAHLELGAASGAETGTFLRWMATRHEDEDLVADLRMMVPVYYDVGRQQVKVWMFLGWLGDSLDVSFERPPAVRGTAGQRVVFEDSSYPIAVPVMVEALVSRLLDREEFRALCDRCGTPDAIVQRAAVNGGPRAPRAGTAGGDRRATSGLVGRIVGSVPNRHLTGSESTDRRVLEDARRAGRAPQAASRLVD